MPTALKEPEKPILSFKLKIGCVKGKVYSTSLQGQHNKWNEKHSFLHMCLVGVTQLVPYMAKVKVTYEVDSL